MTGKIKRLKVKLLRLNKFLKDNREVFAPAVFGAMSGILFFGLSFGLYAVQIPDTTEDTVEELSVITEDFPQAAIKDRRGTGTDVLDVIEENHDNASKKHGSDVQNNGTAGSVGEIRTDDGSGDVVSHDKFPETKVRLSQNVGRANPFAPSGRTDLEKLPTLSEDLMKGINFELVEPPTAVSDAPDARGIMSTRVSGILYDKSRPSAVINVNGTDVLVRIGDTIQNYRIVGIYPDKVAVRTGANVYKASVGESLGAMNKPVPTITSNIEHKFAGAYR